MTATLPATAPAAGEAAAGATRKGKNHYGTGRAFEWKVRSDLEDNGYIVTRSSGSKGAAKWDLEAVKPGQLLWVQCKGSGRCDPDEWDQLFNVAGWIGAVPLLAEKGGRGQPIIYTRLLGPKRRGCRIQPCEPFLLDELAAQPSRIEAL